MAKGLKRTMQLYLCFCLVMVSGGYLGIFEKTAKAEEVTQSNDVKVWAAKSTTFYDGAYSPEPSFDEFMDSDESPAFQFKLDNLNGEITSVNLKFFITGFTYTPGDTLWGTLFGISNDNWVNGYSTYNPQTYSEISYHEYKSTDFGQWKEFDVTDFVKKELTSDSTISFLLQGDRNANPSNSVQIASFTNTNPGIRPVLVITTKSLNEVYSVIYNGNGNDGGSAPIDEDRYSPGDNITVAEQGTLTKSGYFFDGWDTQEDGQGTTYSPNDIIEMGEADTTLYAKWTKPPSVPMPNVTEAVITEDTLSTNGLAITSGPNVTHYKISNIIGGALYKNDGVVQIFDGDFITADEGASGLKFRPNDDANSVAGDTFSFQVQSALENTGKGLSDSVEATIYVSSVNDKPTAKPDQLPSILENSEEYVIPFETLLMNDVTGPANESGETLTIHSVFQGVGGNVRIEGSNVIFTPEANYRGTAGFEYEIQDDGKTGGEVDPQASRANVTFAIDARADQPTVTNAETDEDTQSTAGLVITPTEVGGSVTTHFKITDIQGGELYKNDGSTPIADEEYITVAEGMAGLKFTPNKDAFGTTGFGFKVQAASGTDGNNVSPPVTAAIVVYPVNDAPFAENDDLNELKFGEPSTILFEELLQNDKPGPINEMDQSLTISSVQNPKGGTVEIKDGLIIFTPSKLGRASFDYTIKDSGNETDTATVNFIVMDKQGPVIEINGGDEIFIMLGNEYQELGYRAEDDVEENLTDKVIVTGTVNTDQLGTYEQKYNVSDSSNNAAIEVTRKIHVVSADMSTLIVSQGELTPEFDKSNSDYKVAVPYNLESINITASTLDPTATIVCNGNPLGNNGTHQFSLVEGNNEITIVVTARGGTSKTYSLKVKRGFTPPAEPLVTANDLQNIIIGADSTMEYSVNNGDSWTTYYSENPPKFPGKVTVLVRVKAEGERPAGESKSLSFTINPSSSNNDDKPNIPPNTEIITVHVDGENGKNLTQTPIMRTTTADGKVHDHVTMSEDIAKDTVKKAKAQGVDTARIIIPDTNDQVSEVMVEIPKLAVKQLNEGNMNLELATDNAIISIPRESIVTFNNDLFFKIVPLKSKEQQKQIEERAKQEEIIQEVAKNRGVKVLGRPMEIETNMQGRQVSIILPLKDSLPSDANDRQKILDNLTVYIEHSDGTKEIVQAKAIPFKNTEWGLEFSVSKFSTFTIIQVEGENGETCTKDILTADVIGCLSTKKQVPIYDLVKNRLKKVDVLKGGQSVPAYEAISPMLGIGGDIWVERTRAIRYETPSKSMLAKNMLTGSSRTKQIWKGLELHPGQIGIVTVLQDTAVWGKISKTNKLPRILKKGEQYRVYRYVPAMYQIENGKYLEQTQEISLKKIK